jgi:hypothetical protein
MLYKLAHIIRDKFSWLWDIIECLNGVLFALRYGKKLENIDFKNIPEGYEVTPINAIETKRMVEFFACQPEDAFKFFHPHGFDEKSIKKLQKNKAFLGYVLLDKLNNKIAGYCFNRCFFHGQGFRGRMVDIECRGKGLGTAMNKLLNEVGFGIGVRLFETVSKDNVASYKSALSASNVRVVKELPNNELYLEIIKE